MSGKMTCCGPRRHGTEGTAAHSPLELLKTMKHGVSRWWKPSKEHEARPGMRTEDIEVKKYVHVPTHAASSHLSTTTNPRMAKANDLL